MIPVPPHQLTQGTDQLVIGDTIHVHLLLLVLQAHQPPDVGVWDGRHQAMAREGLLVGVRGFEAVVAVGHFARDTGLDSILGRIPVTELAWNPLSSRHGGAFQGLLPAGLTGRTGPAHGGFLKPGDDVLQGNVAPEPV